MAAVPKDRVHSWSRWAFTNGRERKVHLLAYMSNTTRCGRPISGPKEVDWTEDGVEYATCYRCKELYDTQED